MGSDLFVIVFDAIKSGVCGVSGSGGCCRGILLVGSCRDGRPVVVVVVVLVVHWL